MNVLLKGRSFTAKRTNPGWSSAEGRSSTANSGTKVAVLLGKNRCGCFPLLSAYHSLFNILTDLKRSGKVPGAPVWRRGEWVWLTVPSGLHRNSSQGLNIRSIHGRLARWRKWRACDVEETKGLENELWRRWSNGRVGEWAVTKVKWRKGWRMSCDVDEVTQSLIKCTRKVTTNRRRKLNYIARGTKYFIR